MASDYPAGLDSLGNPIPNDPLDSLTVPHAGQHDDANNAIEAIESTLGTSPQGTHADVKARIVAVEGAAAAAAAAAAAVLPAQTGHDDEFLQTNGSSVLWTPIGDSLPDQTDHAGEYLSTTGAAAYWVDITGGSILPAGGTTGQILAKISDDDYDVGWIDAPTGGGGSWNPGDFVVADGQITGGDSTGTYVDGSVTYRWHKFTTTGTPTSLTVQTAVIGQLLIVGAGGSGGTNHGNFGTGGGGGAGALWTGPYAFGTGIHNAQVGAGGSGASGVSGEDSRFDDIICYGGGGAGPGDYDAGSNGGCGGGGGHDGGAGGTALGGSLDAGATSTTVGFHCSNGQGGNGIYDAGHGGGAGGLATGYEVAIESLTPVVYGIGGSRGSGAAGGANLGSGGGGGPAFSGASGAAGSNGVVIVRYRIV